MVVLRLSKANCISIRKYAVCILDTLYCSIFLCVSRMFETIVIDAESRTCANVCHAIFSPRREFII